MAAGVVGRGVRLRVASASGSSYGSRIVHTFESLFRDEHFINKRDHIWEFPKLGVPFWGPYNKDYSILVSILVLGSPYFGKLPFEYFFWGRNRLQRLATIRWLFVWGKGTRFKQHFRGTCPDNRSYSLLFNKGPRPPMTQERIPIQFFFEFQEPQSFF